MQLEGELPREDQEEPGERVKHCRVGVGCKRLAHVDHGVPEWHSTGLAPETYEKQAQRSLQRCQVALAERLGAQENPVEKRQKQH